MSLEARSRLTCCDWSLLTDCPRGNICKPLISFRCEGGQICKSFFKFLKWLMLEQVWYISKFVKDPCWPQASMWQHLQIPDFFRCESKHVNVAILKLCLFFHWQTILCCTPMTVCRNHHDQASAPTWRVQKDTWGGLKIRHWRFSEGKGSLLECSSIQVRDEQTVLCHFQKALDDTSLSICSNAPET